MKTILVLISIALTTAAWALNKKSNGHEHREHSAHQHGAGTLGIAFDGLTGQLDFKIPSDSIIGFEYTPRTEKDKKTRLRQLALLEKQIAQMVVFDSSRGCVITKDKVEVVKDEKESNEMHAEHSDTVAVFNVTCVQALEGSKITFNFQKYFPRINDLDVQIVVGDIQKSVEAKSNGVSVLIAK